MKNRPRPPTLHVQPSVVIGWDIDLRIRRRRFCVPCPAPLLSCAGSIAARRKLRFHRRGAEYLTRRHATKAIRTRDPGQVHEPEQAEEARSRQASSSIYGRSRPRDVRRAEGLNVTQFGRALANGAAPSVY